MPLVIQEIKNTQIIVQNLQLRCFQKLPLYPIQAHCIAKCMIKFFWGEGVVDGEGGISEGCLKWGGGVIKGSFQKRQKLFLGRRGFEGVTAPPSPRKF